MELEEIAKYMETVPIKSVIYAKFDCFSSLKLATGRLAFREFGYKRNEGKGIEKGRLNHFVWL